MNDLAKETISSISRHFEQFVSSREGEESTAGPDSMFAG